MGGEGGWQGERERQGEGREREKERGGGQDGGGGGGAGRAEAQGAPTRGPRGRAAVCSVAGALTRFSDRITELLSSWPPTEQSVTVRRLGALRPLMSGRAGAASPAPPTALLLLLERVGGWSERGGSEGARREGPRAGAQEREAARGAGRRAAAKEELGAHLEAIFCARRIRENNTRLFLFPIGRWMGPVGRHRQSRSVLLI